MAGEGERATIWLELTKCQKEQIRKATGRTVNVLELRLEGLPEPAEGQEEAPEPDMSEQGLAHRATGIITRTRRGESEKGG
jgi:hypothetical protein